MFEKLEKNMAQSKIQKAGSIFERSVPLETSKQKAFERSFYVFYGR